MDEHVKSPSGQSGRAQVFGMPSSPSIEPIGGNWTGMGSSSSEQMLFYFHFVVLLLDFFSFPLTLLYRSILILPIPFSTLNVNISLCIRLQFAVSTLIRPILGPPHRVFRSPQPGCDQHRGGCSIVIECFHRCLGGVWSGDGG
jgi:hypothetical protein